MTPSFIPSYPWLRFVDLRIGKTGEYYVPINGRIGRLNFDSDFPIVIVEPDNIYGVIRLEDIAIPPGFEPEGDLRSAFQTATGAPFFLLPDGGVAIDFDWTGHTGDRRRLCLRKIAPKTKTVVILETDNRYTVAAYRKSIRPGDSTWTVRFEERPL